MTNLMEYQKKIKERFGIGSNHPLFPVEIAARKHLDAMEERGIPVDKTILKDAERNAAEELMELQKEIYYSSSGIILKANSSAQVARFLESEGVEVKKNRKGSPSTRSEDLEEIDHPIIPLVIKYRGLLSSHSQISSILYADGDRVHPEYDDLTCPTGRVYSRNPNIMGWGEGTQKAITPDPGYRILKADYKAQDLRVLAALSDCKGLKKAFAENQDPHRWVASMMLRKPLEEVTKEERQLGKALNFGTVYLQTPTGLARKLKCSVPEAEEAQEKYHKTYPEIREWSAEVIKETRRTQISRTYFGRERKINMIGAPWFLRDKMERQAVNTPVQGTGADLIKMVLARIPSNSKKLQVLYPWHDALVLQYREDIDVNTIKNYIESIMVVKVKDVLMEIDWA